MNSNSNVSSERSGTGEAYYFNAGAYYFNVVLVSAAVLPNIDSNDTISLDDPSILISKQVVPARRQPRTAYSMSWSSTRARLLLLEPPRVSILLSYPQTDNYATFFTLFMVDYDNLKFTLLISASSRTFSRRQSAAIELFTAAATFSVLIHLLSQVRGGISQDSGRVLTRTLGEYFSGGDPVSLSQLIIMDLH
jgi:hypothetical protein